MGATVADSITSSRQRHDHHRDHAHHHRDRRRTTAGDYGSLVQLEVLAATEIIKLITRVLGSGDFIVTPDSTGGGRRVGSSDEVEGALERPAHSYCPRNLE